MYPERKQPTPSSQSQKHVNRAGLCEVPLPLVPSAQWARAKGNGMTAFAYFNPATHTQILHLTSSCKERQ